MVDLFSYGLGVISAAVSFSVGRISFYWYKKRHDQATEERQDAERWYVSTIDYAREIQQIRDDFEERSDLQQSDTQNRVEIIADNLSSHCAKGEPLNIDETTVTLAGETVEKCREVVRAKTYRAIVGIDSQLKAADESAEQLEQSAKKQL